MIITDKNEVLKLINVVVENIHKTKKSVEELLKKENSVEALVNKR